MDGDTTITLDTTSTVDTTASSVDTTTSSIDTTTSSIDTTSTIDTTTSVDTTSSITTTTTTGAEAGPTVLFTDDDESGHRGEYQTLLSPFFISMYGSSSFVLTVSVNGIISLGTVDQSDSLHRTLPDNSLPFNSVLPYWTENSIIPGSGQGITYQVFGEEPQRRLIIEFMVHPDGNEENEWGDHYAVNFFESRGEYCRVDYYYTSGTGSDATIGNQQTPDGLYHQYSYNTRFSVQDYTFVSMQLNENGEFDSGDLG
ncbi:hypothetical protein ACHAPT_001260 [Fusarium lateritium]